MRTFWPPADAAQADYEALRQAALVGMPSVGAAAARFTRGGLAALIARPAARAEFTGAVVGAHRPPWSAHQDPRLDALAVVFGLVVATAVTQSAQPKEEAR